MALPVLLTMLLLPLAALAALALADERHSRGIAALSALLTLVIGTAITLSALAGGGVNIYEQYGMLNGFVSLNFRLELIPLALVLMSAVVILAAALSGNPEGENERAANALIVLFQVASIGIFISANLFLFFIFWDVGVVAMFLMINLLGSANRRAASINFLLYEIFASALLLFGILLVYFASPVRSFDFSQIAQYAYLIPQKVQLAIFVSLLVAFMVNMPIFPFHFWLPDAHTEASTQGSMLLSGILTKFGAFGMLLLFSLFPISAGYSVYVSAIAIFSTFYSVFLLLRQTDTKRIIAYTTVVDMGIVLLGISAGNSIGTYGAAYLMLAHGVVVALMFLAVGYMKHIFGERDIRILRGTVIEADLTTYALLFGSLATIGFPLSPGFVADLLVFIGAVQSYGAYAVLPFFAIAIMGAYLYFVMSRAFLSDKGYSRAINFPGRAELVGYSVLGLFILLYGLAPFILLNMAKI